jgi:hypothetical protein
MERFKKAAQWLEGHRFRSITKLGAGLVLYLLLIIVDP